jgi:WD40 repeat protein
MSVLQRLLLLWLAIAIILGSSGLYLARRAATYQSRKLSHYSQPQWSEDESQIAYLKWDYAAESPQAEPDDRQLWVGSRIDGHCKKLISLGNQKLKLLGWLDHDKRLLLLPEKLEGKTLRIWLVDVTSATLQEIKFTRSDLEFVCIESGDVFFQRRGNKRPHEVASAVRDESVDSSAPTPDASGSPDLASAPATLDVSELELLMWSPGKNAITPVTSIPVEGDELSIVSAIPSPDDKWVAMVLQLKGELALWLYSREQDRATFANVRVSASSLNVAWSSDSTGLVAAGEEVASSNLHVIWNVQTPEVTTLRTSSSKKNYHPFWPKGEKEFLLVSPDNEVLRFNPQRLEAEKILGRTIEGHPADETAVSPLANWAAFRSQSDNEDRLYYYSLKTKQVRALVEEDSESEYRNSTRYLIGSGLLNGYYYWTGQSKLMK